VHVTLDREAAEALVAQWYGSDLYPLVDDRLV